VPKTGLAIPAVLALPSHSCCASEFTYMKRSAGIPQLACLTTLAVPLPDLEMRDYATLHTRDKCLNLKIIIDINQGEPLENPPLRSGPDSAQYGPQKFAS